MVEAFEKVTLMDLRKPNSLLNISSGFKYVIHLWGPIISTASMPFRMCRGSGSIRFQKGTMGIPGNCMLICMAKGGCTNCVIHCSG